jgi:hypothetical protein
MRRELHVRFCEGGGVRFPSATRRNVYVRSQRAGERVMEALVGLYAKLRLQVSAAKSAVARAWDRQFLGFSFWVAPGRVVKRRVAPQALTALKQRLRQITRRSGGRSLPQIIAELRSYLVGWRAYFRLADTPGIFADVEKWLHRRLRAVILKQWKRGTTTYRELRRRGISDRLARAAAAHAHRWWRIATHGALKTALPIKYFDALRVPRLVAR